MADSTTVSIPTDITPDWTNRRRVINTTLWFCGSMSGLIIVTSCAMVVVGTFTRITTDPGLMGLLGSALYTIAFVATSIIGSYVFGVNFDWANTRAHISSLVATTTQSAVTVPGPASEERVARTTIESTVVGKAS
jgi:hypothetical protein